MEIEYEKFKASVEKSFGRDLTEEAEKAAVDFFNFLKELTDGMSAGSIGVNVDVSRASAAFPALKRYMPWGGIAIILWIFAFVIAIFSWKFAIFVTLLGICAKIYSSRIKKRDAYGFARKVILDATSDHEEGMAKLCAHYIAGHIQLYSRSHRAHWPILPSSVLGGSDASALSPGPNTVSIEDVFDFLTTAVPRQKPSEIAGKFRTMGLTESAISKDEPYSGNVSFEKGYRFICSTTSNAPCCIEVLQRDGEVLQAGIQIAHEVALMEKGNDDFALLKNLCDRHYTDSKVAEVSGTRVINYGNTESVAYLSKMRQNDRNVITFRVGNRLFW
jgi:hypothetical protein